jgi:CubicO group peptidase (beta-lactamase class C family)
MFDNRRAWSITRGVVSTIGLASLIASGGSCLVLLEATSNDRPDTEKIGKVQDFLFLPQESMPATYRRMAQLFATRTIKRGPKAYVLPKSDRSLAVTYQADGRSLGIGDFMSRNDVTGLLIIKDGKIVIEKYASGNTGTTKWPSWSVAKSVTSTLVGAAIRDGFISSVEDAITKFLPQLKGSAYDGTTIRNLLQMSSGVKFSEDYEDRNSDFSRLMQCYYNQKAGCVLDLVKTIPRDVAPGTKFHYATLDTTVVGDVVMAATHQTLAGYLSDKIWSPFGMENDAIWVLESKNGQEFGGVLIGATLRDYGRFGQFILNGGKAGGKQVLPDHWIEEATHPRLDSPQVNYGQLEPDWPDGYGYSWWLYPPGQKSSPNQEEAFEAEGIFGQYIYINPKEKVVGVFWCTWPESWVVEKGLEVDNFLDAVIKSLR